MFASQPTLSYHTKDYFQETISYLFWNGTRFFVDQVHLYNGRFYTNTGLQYEVTTILSCELNRMWLESPINANNIVDDLNAPWNLHP